MQRRCGWGLDTDRQCAQLVVAGGEYCTYHQKIHEGLTESADTYLTPGQLSTLLSGESGRRHGDGRSSMLHSVPSPFSRRSSDDRESNELVGEWWRERRDEDE